MGKDISVDVAVIGAGSAGLNARRAAAAEGASVVMIEGGKHGTTCARVGCMPSKLIIAAADAAHEMQHTEIFGIHAPGKPRIDGPAVLERVRRERDRFVGFVLEDVDEIPAEQKLDGYARFVDRNTLQVGDDTTVKAKSIVLAIGTEPYVPEKFEPISDALLTSDTVFEEPDLPESIAIIGTGIIAMELGQAMHRLGVRTTIFGRSHRLVGLTSPAVTADAAKIFKSELDLRFDTPIDKAAIVDDKATLWFQQGGQEMKMSFDKVLLAAGRHPNFRRVHLSEAGLASHDNGVPLFNNQTMQCGDSSVFIAGDVNGERELLHEASDEGRIAGTNAARFPKGIAPGLRRTPLAAVFTDPNVAMVGQSYQELLGTDPAIGKVSYWNQGRSRVMNLNRGMVELYGDKSTGRLLGAEMVGPRMEHMAHLLAWSIQQELTVERMLEMPFYHPVFEEGIRTGLRDLKRALSEG